MVAQDATNMRAEHAKQTREAAKTAFLLKRNDLLIAIEKRSSVVNVELQFLYLTETWEYLDAIWDFIEDDSEFDDEYDDEIDNLHLSYRYANSRRDTYMNEFLERRARAKEQRMETARMLVTGSASDVTEQYDRTTYISRYKQNILESARKILMTEACKSEPSPPQSSQCVEEKNEDTQGTTMEKVQVQRVQRTPRHNKKAGIYAKPKYRKPYRMRSSYTTCDIIIHNESMYHHKRIHERVHSRYWLIGKNVVISIIQENEWKRIRWKIIVYFTVSLS